MDSPSTLLRVVSLSNHGSSPECEDLGPMDLIHNPDKNVQTRNYLIFISISLVVTAVLYFFDVPIWHAARDLAEPDYLLFPEFLSDWGLYLFYTIFSIVFVVGLIKKRPNLINIALAYIKAQLVFSLVVVRLLKFVLGRPRPGYGFELILFTTRASHHSFPSGHSADAFASGVCLFYLLSQSKYSQYRFLPLVYAFMIAASRVFVSSHFPSDVSAGMAIGIMGAWFFLSRLPDQSHQH
jgi:undecaprenyl-diphosphatase